MVHAHLHDPGVPSGRFLDNWRDPQMTPVQFRREQKQKERVGQVLRLNEASSGYLVRKGFSTITPP